MSHSFGQFCPIALSSELLTQRWMLLIIRELLAGSSRFNSIRRGVPKISATLLKQRLDTLERAKVVVKTTVATGQYEYLLTEAGKQLQPVLVLIGEWGQRWARDIKTEDLDPGWLIWNIHRRLNLDLLPPAQTVMEFEFVDAKPKERFFWIIALNQEVDVCLKNPGLPVTIKIKTQIQILAEVWRGIRNLNSEIKSNRIALQGSNAVKAAFPRWLKLSAYAPIKREQ